MISLDYPSSLRFSPEKLAAEELCALDFGIDNTGTLDNTALMQALHSTGRRIYYPNGVYLFNGDTLDLSGGVRFETREGVTIRNRISPMNIIVFDDFGDLIGLMENHLEYTERDLGRTSGSLVPPPLSQSKRKTRVDLIAYWYNDFGLQCHKTLRYGWIGWHYWTWNHHDAAVSPALREQFGRQMDGYDPSRHPLLGFYHGDDPTVLDWQCYWLYEYGVNAVSLLGGNLARWEDPLHGSHFVYQLFHHVKNFKNLKYIMTGPTPWVKPEDAPAAAREVEDTCLRLLDKTYAAFPNYYAFTEDGADFPVLSFLGENALLSVFDPAGGIDGTVTFYLRLAQAFRQRGFGGVTVFAVFPDPRFDAPDVRRRLEENGVRRYLSNYTPWHVDQSLFKEGTYRALVDSYAPPNDPHTILAVGNSVNTHTPHESAWHCPGNTPALFAEYLRKALDHLDRCPAMRRTVTCYNLSEWAEGGPGLQPNVYDRFGYLDAIRSTVVIDEKEEGR